MAHHGSEMPEEFRRMLNRTIGGDDYGLGPTGEFPRGKIHECDEGEIKIAVAGDPKTNTVVIDFGKPTTWIGFSPEQAVEIANLLTLKAWALRGIQQK